MDGQARRGFGFVVVVVVEAVAAAALVAVCAAATAAATTAVGGLDAKVLGLEEASERASE